jgi:pentapeptide MXKDX repeat protein
MKKILIAGAMTLMCSSAFAQGTGPKPQSDNMTKPGMTNGAMDKGSMDKGSMNNTTGMGKDSMKKDMSKDGSPNANTKKNDGTSK